MNFYWRKTAPQSSDAWKGL